MDSLDLVNTFFAPPLPAQPSGYGMSVLHLLRREIQDCFFGDVFPEDTALEQPVRHRLFATAMLLVAGVDLLAKLYEGADNHGGSGRRFKAFASRFLFKGLKNPDVLADVLWTACRNPLLHSFGLHNQDYALLVIESVPGPAGQFSPVLVRGQDDKTYVLSVAGLFLAFCRAVNEYRDLLLANPDLRRRFEAQFPKYGRIDVADVEIRGQERGFTLRPLP